MKKMPAGAILGAPYLLAQRAVADAAQEKGVQP
jgi:hypothetical protein